MKRLAIEIGICSTFIISSALILYVCLSKLEHAKYETEMAKQDASDAENTLQFLIANCYNK